MMMALPSQNTPTPAGQILEHLLRSGSATIKELEQAVGVTAVFTQGGARLLKGNYDKTLG